MAKEKVEVMVEGGKATAAPPLGPALGPMGVNIGQVIAKINEKTKAFAGMKVPVKVIIDKSTKAFDIEVGTGPTTSASGISMVRTYRLVLSPDFVLKRRKRREM